MKRKEVVDYACSLYSHDEIVKKYNKIEPLPVGYKLQPNDAWCAATVSVIFNHFKYDDLAECSCVRMKAKAKNLDIWKDKPFMPDIGDIIMYDWNFDNIPDHVGVIVETRYTWFPFVVVLEGNYNNRVGRRLISLESESIHGFITPPYMEDEKDTFQDIKNFFDTLE